MSKLPVVSGKDAPVPNHKEIAKGTLRSLIRESGLTVEEFTQLLR